MKDVKVTFERSDGVKSDVLFREDDARNLAAFLRVQSNADAVGVDGSVVGATLEALEWALDAEAERPAEVR